MMDHSKAFDAIPHDLLLVTLHLYALSKNACEMIRSYLSNHKQRVKIDDVRSSWQYTVKDIPQVSQTGSRIFNMLLNDMLSLLRLYDKQLIKQILAFLHKLTMILM